MSTEKPDSIWPEWGIKEQIGEGSFGKVYKAERTEHNMTSVSAIKVLSIPQSQAEYSSLRSEGMDETSARTYFEGIVDDCINEIKLMESMKGTSNIVSVEDYKVVERQGEVGWDIYIRMELVQSFVDYLADKRLDEQEVIRLGIDVCSALELCAKKNIIHRDIKPENIFISTFGDFKVGDFGIARELEKTTGALSSKGTYNYMAPEVAAAKHYDATVDTYSLGLVLYRLLNNNRMPFADPDAEMVTYQQRKDALDRRLKGEPLPLPAKASMPMAQVIIKACAFNPQLRFRSATEMKAALMAVREGGYVPHVMPVSLSPEDDTQPTYDLDATTAVRRAPQAQDYTAAPVIAPQTQTFGKEKRKSRSTMVIALVAALCAFVVIGVGVALYVLHPWDPGDTQVIDEVAPVLSSEEGSDEGESLIAGDEGGLDEPSPSAQADIVNRVSSAHVGDVIHFGKVAFVDFWGGGFSQDIGWRVLAVEEGRVLVISEDSIDLRPYNTAFKAVTWENCDLRMWLNSDFYNSLPMDLRPLVMTTQINNKNNTVYGTKGGNDTADRVFLLSLDEAERYFKSDRDRQAQLNITPEAISGVNKEYAFDIEEYVKEYGGRWWWLRSPGNGTDIAAYINSRGLLYTIGNNVDRASGGVRPAFWIDTSTAIARGVSVDEAVTPKANTMEVTAPAVERPWVGDVEGEVLRIRGIWNTDRSAVAEGRYQKKKIRDGVTAYYDNGELKNIEITKGTDGIAYLRILLYSHGELIFAYYEGADQNRLYFKDGYLFRWRVTDAAGNVVNHDNESALEGYLYWERTAKAEASGFM